MFEDLKPKGYMRHGSREIEKIRKKLQAKLPAYRPAVELNFWEKLALFFNDVDTYLTNKAKDILPAVISGIIPAYFFPAVLIMIAITIVLVILI